MDKLELEHIAPYLPYNLKGITRNGSIFLLSTYSNMGGSVEKREIHTFVNEQFKPILRPLSEIFDIEEINNEFSDYDKEVFINSFFIFDGCLNRFSHVNYTIVQLCFKYHLDILGLIKKGLAIDINTLKDENKK